MSRVRTGPYTHRRRKKWLRAAKGYWGRRKNLYKSARIQVMHGLISAYRERKRKKRTFRRLMIVRLNAGLRQHGINYSTFIHKMKQAGMELDRSVLSEMAIHAPEDLGQRGQMVTVVNTNN